MPEFGWNCLICHEVGLKIRLKTGFYLIFEVEGDKKASSQKIYAYSVDYHIILI